MFPIALYPEQENLFSSSQKAKPCQCTTSSDSVKHCQIPHLLFEHYTIETCLTATLQMNINTHVRRHSHLSPAQIQCQQTHSGTGAMSLHSLLPACKSILKTVRDRREDLHASQVLMTGAFRLCCAVTRSDSALLWAFWESLESCGVMDTPIGTRLLPQATIAINPFCTDKQ